MSDATPIDLTPAGTSANDAVPAAAGRFDALLDAATRRLARDPDLRLEVRQELLGHLEDAAAEHRAAGTPAAEAADRAARELGDPDALADQLWQANRRRVRARTVGRWAFGLVVAAAAVAVCYALVAWVLTTAAALQQVTGGSGGIWGAGSPPPLPEPSALTRQAWDRLADGLPPDARAMFGGGPFADGKRALAEATALAARHPDDPVLHAYLAARSIEGNSIFEFDDHGDVATVDGAKLDALTALLDRGSALEPGNGYYLLLKADVLFQASSTVRSRAADDEDDRDDREPGFRDPPGMDYAWDRQASDRVEVTDAETFRRGLDALRDAAARPYVDAHWFDLARRRSNLLPPPRGVGDDVRAGFFITASLPHSQHLLSTFRTAGGHAVALARSGDLASAEAILAGQRRIALVIAARAPATGELYLAHHLMEMVDIQLALAYKAAGRGAEFR